jgi:transposase
MMELKQLIQLKQKGYSNRRTAEELGVSRNTVNSYVKLFKGQDLSYKQLADYNEEQLRELFPARDYKQTDRYEALADFFPYMQAELAKPGCTLQALWGQYLQKHPGGYGYTQFTTHFNRWAKTKKASGILQHEAGRHLFIDFAGKKLQYVDRTTGEVIPVDVFVGILPASQYTYVRACRSQKREELVEALNRCLQFLGGVPKAIVSDNMKAAVARGHRYAPIINKTIKAFGLHYDTVLDPTRPYRPKDKAMVENAVKLVYQRIYYPLSSQTFFSLDALNKAIGEQLEAYNEQYCFQHTKTTRRQRFLEVEKQHLQPLPAGSYQLRHYKRARVQKISHIWLSADKAYYSVPHRYVGREVQVEYNRDLVEIFSEGERIAVHRRRSGDSRYITDKRHMPSTHREYGDWSPAYFRRRAWKVGRYTARYIGRLMGQYKFPEWAYKQAQGILAQGPKYGDDRLEAACRRALSIRICSFRTIEQILKNKQDQAPDLFEAAQSSIPDHDNIRGAGYYQ